MSPIKVVSLQNNTNGPMVGLVHENKFNEDTFLCWIDKSINKKESIVTACHY